MSEFEKVVQNPTNDNAIIVDIDWTLADNSHRDPYDFSKVSEDKPYGDIIELVRVLSQTYEIVFVSGRWEECQKDTFDWLVKNFPGMGVELIMRKEWDKRKDSYVKYEILQDLIKEYFIAYVFDDRNQVVKMWREAGLRCLQVQEWNF